MASAEPNDTEGTMPFLVLMATDGKNNEYEAVKKKDDSEEEEHRPKAGTIELWLRIEYQKKGPSDGHILRDSEKSGEHERVPLNMLKRAFDTGKGAEIDILFKPGDHSQKKAKLKATTDDKFSLGYWELGPGEYELKLIGSINFKYLDMNGKPLVFENMRLDLSFWFDIAVNQDPPLEEDSDAPSPKGYYTEQEIKQMSS